MTLSTNQTVDVNSPSPCVARRVERVRHVLQFRDVQVARVESIGPDFVRVVFSGESLADFVSQGFYDHVKFILARPGAAADAPPDRRDYAPRAWSTERRELSIDFALHPAGVASDWARQAAPGQTLVIAGPRGSMVVPTDYDWHLLIGDATAAAAIGRRLAELPEGARAIVVAQLADTAILEVERSAGPAATPCSAHWPAWRPAVAKAISGRRAKQPRWRVYATWCCTPKATPKRPCASPRTGSWAPTTSSMKTCNEGGREIKRRGTPTRRIGLQRPTDQRGQLSFQE